MIEHVYRRAQKASAADVFVATDDERVRDVVEGFGGKALMTSERHPSGTDRLAEAVKFIELRGADIVINVQADEPLIEPEMINEAGRALTEGAGAAIGTLRKAIEDEADLANPHVVKVVVDITGRALYFSRAGLPYARDGRRVGTAWRHIGIYAYRRDALLTLAGLPPTPLEQSESLEQLRALEHGFGIHTLETSYDTIGVDTAADLEQVRRRISGT